MQNGLLWGFGATYTFSIPDKCVPKVLFLLSDALKWFLAKTWEQKNSVRHRGCVKQLTSETYNILQIDCQGHRFENDEQEWLLRVLHALTTIML